MKKGILLEKHKRYWLVLTSQGEFKKISPKRSGEIGGEVSLGYSFSRMVLQAAALLLVFFLSASFFVSYTTVAAYVTVDINPSVELGLNRYGLVIDMKALNEEGQVVLPEKKFFRNLDDTVQEIVDSAISNGYLALDKEEENVILLGLSASDNLDRWTKELDEVVKHTSSSIGSGVEVKVINAGVDSEIRVRASELDMSLGKYLLYEKVESFVVDLDEDVLKESLGKGGIAGFAKELGVSPSELVRNADDKEKLKEVFRPGMPEDIKDDRGVNQPEDAPQGQVEQSPGDSQEKQGMPKDIPRGREFDGDDKPQGQNEVPIKGGPKRNIEGEEISED